jgi:hypothetical protein
MSITDLEPPAARDIPRATDERIRRTLRAAVAESAPAATWPRAPLRRVVVVAVAAVAALTLAALASTGILQRAVGDLGPGTKSPAAVVDQIRSDWTKSLTEGAAKDPAASFQNLPSGELEARLAAAAKSYGFSVRDLTILHPKQDAPAIVVQAAAPAKVIAGVPAIMRTLDPKAPGADNEGWAYEGFFFEVVDKSGRPVLVVANTWRSPNAGGTQWAAPGYELPYAHG